MNWNVKDPEGGTAEAGKMEAMEGVAAEAGGGKMEAMEGVAAEAGGGRAAYFIGIDIGTQGARVVLMDAAGNLAGSEERACLLSDRSREEQSPVEWWEGCLSLLRALVVSVAGSIDRAAIRAIAVTSTSGTVIPLDRDYRPLHDAIMYSDQRSAEEGRFCREMALRCHPDGYTGFNSSSGLSKMVWYQRKFPAKAQAICAWVHAADYITGMLSGRWHVTDYTNALKSGYDLRGLQWPSWLFEGLGLQRYWLPEVVAPGTPVGRLLPALALELGLGTDVRVVAGMTDGCASQIASGAVAVGDWNTTIGTTMVIKGVTERQVRDPDDALYCHRHPEGFWMPGGASNTGADWVSKEFHEDLDALNEGAASLIPTGLIAWPLCQHGERFPFVAPQARGFSAPGLSPVQRFAANMEGVACLERYAYELIGRWSGSAVKAVYTAGGASNSDTWLTIRSNVLGMPLYKMRYVSAAAGAAILAASGTHFGSLTAAARTMTQVEKRVSPSAALSDRYDGQYRQFLATLRQKGYIREGAYA
ncbi:MAG TPA: FGGY-family carbohydrate kinase [Puia sp.]|nr:FGGY-family carbohydrate kinase [Puia sp.]